MTGLSPLHPTSRPSGQLPEDDTVFGQVLRQEEKDQARYAALYYASLGLPVFPVKIVVDAKGKEQKTPCIKDWPNQASTDSVVVSRWWTELAPGAMIGIVTGHRSGWGVIDVDCKNGAKGFDSLYSLADELAPLNSSARGIAFGDITPQDRLKPSGLVRTRSGGLHLWYRLGERSKARGRMKIRGLPGIEFKASGNYVVSPPSAGYEWLRHLPAEREVGVASAEYLATAPVISETLLERLLDGGDDGSDWMADGDENKIVTRGRGAELLRDAVATLMTTPEGDGNNTVYRLSCDLYPYVALGELTKQEVDRAVWAGISRWGADENTIQGTMASAWKRTGERTLKFNDDVWPAATAAREVDVESSLRSLAARAINNDVNGIDEDIDRPHLALVPSGNDNESSLPPSDVDDNVDDDDGIDEDRVEMIRGLMPPEILNDPAKVNQVINQVTTMRVTDVARTIHRALSYVSEEPPTELSYTLAQASSMLRPTREFHVEKVFARRHIVTLVGRHKSGKTTLAGNLVQSLVDGDPFLGQFEVTGLSGNVGMWNGEMDAQDFDEYLLAMKIREMRRVQIAHLQGYKVNLLSDEGRKWAIKWLGDRDIEVWVPDPWSKICSWSGIEENDNTGVKQLQVRIEEIRREAGVVSIFMPIHPPRAEDGQNGSTPRARGAAAMDEWPDALWTYSRDDDQRYLAVEGRGGVGLDETAISYDAGTNRLGIVGGNRREIRRGSLGDRVIEIVTDREGIMTSDIYSEVGGDRNEVSAAIKQLERDGKIHSEPGERPRSKVWRLGSGLPTWAAAGIGAAEEAG